MGLIKLYNGSLVDARELHQFLEIKTDFPTWIGRTLLSHFEDGKDFSSFLRKTPQKGGRPQKDYYLTIETAKKLAMMAKTPKGDEARQYFIECEKVVIELKQNKRFEAFFKLEATKERLKQNVLNIGGTEADFVQIDMAGSKVFFNGKPIPDEELPRLLLLSRDLATELTNNQLGKSEYSIDEVEKLNKDNHSAIRGTLKSRGVIPEELPTEERIKKLGE